MVALLLERPPSLTMTDKETRSPAGASSGILAFTWYTPTSPGASPENNTSARMVPIITIVVPTVFDSTSDERASVWRRIRYGSQPGAIDLNYFSAMSWT